MEGAAKLAYGFPLRSLSAKATVYAFCRPSYRMKADLMRGSACGGGWGGLLR
jgi:hypothetical protein